MGQKELPSAGDVHASIERLREETRLYRVKLEDSYAKVAVLESETGDPASARPTPDGVLTRAGAYRERARRIRELADTTSFQALKEKLLEVVGEYERLAIEVERHETEAETQASQS
jgi:hypothetical protein